MRLSARAAHAPHAPARRRFQPTYVPGAFLAWRPPRLDNPTTVVVTDGNSNLKLTNTKDYIVQMPATPITSELNVWGGRRVILIGGEVNRTTGRGAFFHGQTEAMYCEGLKITGTCTEGIDLEYRTDAAVIIQNIYVTGLTGSLSTNHADCIQTWAGPNRLFIDRFRGESGYQGFFLLPTQQWTVALQGTQGPWPSGWDFRRVQLTAPGYCLYCDPGPPFPINVSNVYCQSTDPLKVDVRDQILWPKQSTPDHSWDAVTVGVPATPFVDPTLIGCGYTSFWP